MAVQPGLSPRFSRSIPFISSPSRGAIRLVAPVLLAGAAAAMLFFSVNRSVPWTIASATMGMGLLGAVLCRQLGLILSLEQQVVLRAGQLSIVSELVALLNASPNVGTTLGAVLDRLMHSLHADWGVVWLPAPGDAAKMNAVEQRGIAAVDGEARLLEHVLLAMRDASGHVVYHPAELAGPDGASHGYRCITVRLGQRGEEFGYLALGRSAGEFAETDGVILSTVGSNVGGALRSVRMITEARRQSDLDTGTGLFNHRSAYQRLNSELERHAKSSQPMAVIIADLDNFKLFNDTYGHPAGDDVLKRVSAILKQACRGADIVARYGGDEFLVILPETGLAEAVRCAERIQAAVGKERFRCKDSASLPIGFSYGVACYPEDGRETRALMSAADANLLKSKHDGGNRITARLEGAADRGMESTQGCDFFRAMIQAIDNKDGYTRQHSDEVTNYSLQIARAIELDDQTLRTIQISGLLHDVGKIGVPDHILRKPGKLTDEEFAVMQQHPVFGAMIVGAMPGMQDVVLGVKYHHERYDGKGYPERLAGEDIPLIGRIMAVADAFSAMTTSRPYRKGLTEQQALDEIRRGLGTQFDPRLGEVFIRIREETTLNSAAPSRKPARKKADEPEEALLRSGS